MHIKRIILFSILIIILMILGLSIKRPPSATGVERWGVTFSHQFAEYMGIDWQDAYIAILDELKPPIMRIPVYWDDIEKTRGEFDFETYDFLVNEAEKRNVELTLVVGMRVPRWPECHIPKWAQKIPLVQQKKEVKDAIIAIVDRYKDRDIISTWQVENEPFLPFFGDCPLPDGEQIDEEIDLVRFIDTERPIIITDSGELSTWFSAFKRGDIFGTTMYRTVWSNTLSPYIGYFTYPLPPKFFWMKANINHLLYGRDKKIIVSELQAEPWGPESSRINDMTEEQSALTMSKVKFYENIDYAREVGFPDVYLWGVEWWYFMKEYRDNPFYWEAGKEVISTSK